MPHTQHRSRGTNVRVAHGPSMTCCDKVLMCGHCVPACLSIYEQQQQQQCNSVALALSIFINLLAARFCWWGAHFKSSIQPAAGALAENAAPVCSSRAVYEAPVVVSETCLELAQPLCLVAKGVILQVF